MGRGGRQGSKGRTLDLEPRAPGPQAASATLCLYHQVGQGGGTPELSSSEKWEWGALPCHLSTHACLLPASWQCRGTAWGMRLPAWCRHTTLAISCWHCLELARARADSASLPTISHLGVKPLSVGWGAPSTLPVSPCGGKPAAPTSDSPAAAPLKFWRPGASGGGAGGTRLLTLCRLVTARTTLATGTPGPSARPRQRPCLLPALPRRPAELSVSLEPSPGSSGRGFLCLPFCKRQTQVTGTFALLLLL